MNKNNQSGRTMIEVLAVLSILGMLTATIMAAINATYDKYKVSKITWQITDLQRNINKRFAADGDYSNLTIQGLIADNVPPPEMITNSAALHHAFGRKVLVASADAGGYNGQNKAFTIPFEDLPFNVCTELLGINWQANNYSELTKIEVGGVEYKWPDNKTVQAGSPYALPMDLIRARQACKFNDITTIKWTFY